jgi:hypothetical protein
VGVHFQGEQPYTPKNTRDKARPPAIGTERRRSSQHAICRVKTANYALLRTLAEKKMAGVTGLEPATSGVTGRRSNRLSYTPGAASASRSQRRSLVYATRDATSRTAGDFSEVRKKAWLKNGGGARRSLEPEPSRAGLEWRLRVNENGGR